MPEHPNDIKAATNAGGPPLWARILAALAIPAVVAALTFGAGMILALMLAFMSDAGLPHPERQGNAFGWALGCLAFAGLSGIPAGLAVLLQPWRRVLLTGALAMAGLGILGTAISVAVYVTAFF